MLRVAATIRIDVLESGWHEIPLRLAAAAVGTATVDGNPARLVGDAQQGYTLIVNHAGEDPIKLELELEYATRIEKQPGRNRVAIHPPLAAVNRWTIRIDEPGVDVELKPLVAATRIAAGEGEAGEEPRGSDQTGLRADGRRGIGRCHARVDDRVDSAGRRCQRDVGDRHRREQPGSHD